MEKKWKKRIIQNSKFYISVFIKNEKNRYLIFIHGGPGLNNGLMDYLLENENFFVALNYNIILYDQRGCGKSLKAYNSYSHLDNVNDLKEIYHLLTEEHGFKVQGMIGHSYGSKLLLDFYNKFKINIPGVFLSIANSMLIPRLNNLLLDLNYIKALDVEKYKKIYKKINSSTFENLWELTEYLNPIFFKNVNRPYMYWANMECYEKVKKIQDMINMPINKKVFREVREKLYSEKTNLCVNIVDLKSPKLWINGVYDYVMNGSVGLTNIPELTPFYKSSHYPHLEENDRFCEAINEFIK